MFFHRSTCISWTSPLMLLIVLTIGMSTAWGQADRPEPGKLTLQSVELPKSTSNWDYKDGIPNLGVPSPADLTETEKIAYWIFLPKTKDAARPMPLMLFLHGAGERGDDPEKVKVHGPPKLLGDARYAETWPFLLVAPQCKTGHRWSPEQLFLLLDAVEKEYNVDRQRIYVTGISMGGFGTWMMLNTDASRIAAAIPICGGGDPAWADKMLKTPIRVFHGDADKTVDIDMSRRMVDAIKKAGGDKVTFTVYPGVGHDSWTRTYENPEIYEWLLRQKLPK